MRCGCGPIRMSSRFTTIFNPTLSSRPERAKASAVEGPCACLCCDELSVLLRTSIAKSLHHCDQTQGPSTALAFARFGRDDRLWVQFCGDTAVELRLFLSGPVRA